MLQNDKRKKVIGVWHPFCIDQYTIICMYASVQSVSVYALYLLFAKKTKLLLKKFRNRSYGACKGHYCDLGFIVIRETSIVIPVIPEKLRKPICIPSIGLFNISCMSILLYE